MEEHADDRSVQHQEGQTAIEVNNLSAVWSTTEHAISGSTVVSNISFKFNNFEKVAIIGKVGCGKSTLFGALLKEAYVVQGNATISGSPIIGYAEQNPVIITGTVRSNILFGEPYHKAYYDQVVKACQLTQDFASFPKADLTETGEMGISLSGG